MSTRSNIIVHDADDRIQIYRHGNGYPESVLADFTKVFPYAWPLPRFEAQDFAAAIVRAWKNPGGGNIYIDKTPKRFELVHDDVEWVYVVGYEPKFKEIVVKIYDWHHHWFNRSNIKDLQFTPRCKKILSLQELQLKQKGGE